MNNIPNWKVLHWVNTSHRTSLQTGFLSVACRRRGEWGTCLIPLRWLSIAEPTWALA